MSTHRDPDDVEPPDTHSDAELDRELARGDELLGASLRSLLSPPSDIEERVADQVSQQLIGRSAAGTALDLLGLGVRTFMMFLSEDPSAADRDRERPDDGPNRDEQDRRATA